MVNAILAAGLFGLEAAAFPHIMRELAARGVANTARDGGSPVPAPGSDAARAISAARSNCGVVPCTTFDAKEQYIDTTSAQHKFISPKSTDIRGPCPGLNAAANHGYIPRNGILNTQQTIDGLAALYGMADDLSAFLAVFSIGTDGDPIAGTWSIGGPLPVNKAGLGLVGEGEGISYSHNTYEGDASIARGDAYINNGDAYSLQMPRFKEAFASTSAPDRYSLDAFAQQYRRNVYESISQNPWAFWAPFSGLVAPAAYNFVINFMSNHSAAEPSGYLNGEMFKQFFAITGDSPSNFRWCPGQERVPDNWYRRPSSNPYSIAEVFGDLGAQFLAYPDSFRMGGNTGKVNSYEGVDISDLTGGAYDEGTLFTNKNALACFAAQYMESVIPDAADNVLADLSRLTSAVNGLDCPVVAKYDQTVFNKFPGHNYHPAPH